MSGCYITISVVLSGFIGFFGAGDVVSSEVQSYVDGSRLFIEIKDANRQADAWAKCAAVYEIMSSMMESGSASSSQFNNLRNGASVAVTMAVFTNGMDPDIYAENFGPRWEYAKLAGQEWPNAQLTSIMADREALGDDAQGVFPARIIESAKVCKNNLHAQQMYIDTWRELLKSGLFTPSKQ